MVSRVDQPIKDETLEILRRYIAVGDYGPGDRLPSERALIDSLNIGRSALRNALDQLEREGVIWRHVGKGTFVSHGIEAEAADDLLSGLGHQLTPFRMVRARLVIEPAIAREAAVNASRDAISRMKAVMTRARAAASWVEYERQDDQFHRCIAEAADNLLLLALFDSLKRVHREVAWGTVERDSPRPPKDHTSFAEHEEIAAAIEAHDPDRAYQAMRAHIQSVSARLFNGQ